MKKINEVSIALFTMMALLAFISPASTLAATTPSLGAAATYGVLGSTYTNTTAGTTINGDVGFTTEPAVAPAGTHTNYGSGAPYATAGTDQGSALSSLASQGCTFTFASGAINLSTDTTHGSAGVYAPGVYCSTGAMNVGGPLTLSGSGTYIFRPIGALDSTAGAVVTLSGASACDVFWTPSAATTLAANTTFFGNVIDNAGITVGANTTWTGRALAFGGTVTTATDTITAPSCTVPPVTPPVTPPPATPSLATLRVVKQVVNNSGGAAVASAFNLHVKLSGTDVAGSPALGTGAPGSVYTLSAGTYVVSEDANALSYAQSFSGACNASGSITLVAGTDVTCTVVNDDIEPVVVVPPVVPPVVTPPVVPPITPSAVTPTLPATGFPPAENNASWNIIIPAGLLAVVLSLYLARKKQII